MVHRIPPLPRSGHELCRQNGREPRGRLHHGGIQPQQRAVWHYRRCVLQSVCRIGHSGCRVCRTKVSASRHHGCAPHHLVTGATSHRLCGIIPGHIGLPHSAGNGRGRRHAYCSERRARMVPQRVPKHAVCPCHVRNDDRIHDCRACTDNGHGGVRLASRFHVVWAFRRHRLFAVAGIQQGRSLFRRYSEQGSTFAASPNCQNTAPVAGAEPLGDDHRGSGSLPPLRAGFSP